MANTYCFAKFKGKDQGDFNGESVQPEMSAFVEVLSFSQGASAPFDPTSGKPAGQVRQSEITFTKHAGKASVNFIQAMTGAEEITEATFDFWRTNDAGDDENWLSVVVKAAFVSNFSYGQGSSEEISETVSLSFDSITWNNKADSMEFEHRWTKK